ncbi:MAG: 3-isopropylmalate/(R)-2-methylmalate dehydratase small subunit, partial [Gaiellales bacterium]|nr:3-isopropylmalate/(R)-2-methylmalate dehydratase small subunit [Gaiellales bacterium]
MRIEGTAVVIRLDDVDTDVLYPGRYIGILDDDEMAKHLFEGLDPTLRDQLVGPTILVGGANFG